MAIPLPVLHILVALADSERHGYAIMQDVAARTAGAVRLGPGTLYGSIKRMLHDGLIEELEERPDPEEDDVRRRYYRITPRGRRLAREELGRLAALVRHARAAGPHGPRADESAPSLSICRGWSEDFVYAACWRPRAAERCSRAVSTSW